MRTSSGLGRICAGVSGAQQQLRRPAARGAVCTCEAKLPTDVCVLYRIVLGKHLTQPPVAGLEVDMLYEPAGESTLAMLRMCHHAANQRMSIDQLHHCRGNCVSSR